MECDPGNIVVWCVGRDRCMVHTSEAEARLLQDFLQGKTLQDTLAATQSDTSVIKLADTLSSMLDKGRIYSYSQG